MECPKRPNSPSGGKDYMKENATKSGLPDRAPEGAEMEALKNGLAVPQDDLREVMLADMQRGAAYGGAVAPGRRPRRRCRFIDDEVDDQESD